MPGGGGERGGVGGVLNRNLGTDGGSAGLGKPDPFKDANTQIL